MRLRLCALKQCLHVMCAFPLLSCRIFVISINIFVDVLLSNVGGSFCFYSVLNANLHVLDAAIFLITEPVSAVMGDQLY